MKKLLLFLALIFVAYLLLMGYIFSGKHEGDKELCAKYIPLIESYQTQHGHYPTTLDDPMISKTCGYHRESDGYTFYFSDGFLGVMGYDSKREEWWYD